jgi:hypothetical protein
MFLLHYSFGRGVWHVLFLRLLWDLFGSVCLTGWSFLTNNCQLFSPYHINLSFIDYSEESFALVPHKSLDVILLTQTVWSSTFLFVDKYFSTSLSSSLSLGATSSFSVSLSSSQFICSASLRVLRGCSCKIIALVGNIVGKDFEGFGASFRTCVIVYNHV